MSNVVRSAAVRLTMENSGYIRGARQADQVTAQTTASMQRHVRQTAVSTGRDWDTMGKYGGRTALAVGTGIAFAEKKIISFDKTMSAAGAATEATAAQQDKLRAAAIKAGADTAFTTTEAAQAITEEGKAGIRTADILSGGLTGALNLAAAGSIDVASAAEDMSTALVQFHLKGGQATHVADLLAAASNKAQGEVGDMSLALSYVGVPAHAARISLEETVGTIALLAKNGLIGEKAGTALRGMLASLQAPSVLASKVMKKYGIDVYDTTGKFKGFDGVAEQLHKRLGGLTDQERQYALGKIFGNEQLQAANILYEQGAKGVHKMTREVNDQGYASKVANEKLDNLAGDWERFTGSLESAFIKAGTPAQGALRDIVQNAEHMVNAFAALPDEVQSGLLKIAVLAGAVGGVLYTISKIRNVARDIRGLGSGRGGPAGGLGRAASLAAPVPVFVTNLGAGGLGGIGGKGGPTILGGGAGGKLKGFRLPAGTGLVATATGLALIATGTTDKTHTGSSVTGSLVGGQIFGVPGALIGGGVGALHDVYNSGNQAADALERAKKALESGTIKEQKDALADLRKEAEKLATGGWGQNFARGVTELTGRRQEIEETGKALEETLDEHRYSGNMLWLLSGGRMGKEPKNRAPAPVLKPPKPPKVGKEALDTLLDPSRGGGKKPQPKTSQQVLADFYGVDVKKLKPVPLFDRIVGVFGTNAVPTPGASHTKNAIRSYAVALGLDTKAFDRDGKRAKQAAGELDKLHPTPRLRVEGVPEAMGATAALKRLIDSLHDRDIHIKVTKTTNATVAEASANGGADGMTVPGARWPYGDKELTPTAPGEEIISNRFGQADKNRAALKAANRGARIGVIGYGGGGTVGSVSPVGTAGQGAPIDYGRLAAAYAGNQLLGTREARDMLVSAMRTVFREAPILRASPDAELLGLTS